MATHLDSFSLESITVDAGATDLLTNDHGLILSGLIGYHGADGTGQSTSFDLYLSGGEFGATKTKVGTYSFPAGALLGGSTGNEVVYAQWSFNLETLGLNGSSFLNDGTYTLYVVNAGGNINNAVP